jgi:hypothetical protein
LSSRFADITGSEKGAGYRGLLAVMPREANLYLYALAVAENELSAPEFSEFAAGLGLKPEGELLVRKLLSRAGLVDPTDTRTIVEPVDKAAIAEAIGPDAAAMIDRLFAAFLIGLYRSGRIRPSLGFLRRVGERAEEERLLYDCLFEEVLRPDRPGHVEPGFLSPSSAPPASPRRPRQRRGSPDPARRRFAPSSAQSSHTRQAMPSALRGEPARRCSRSARARRQNSRRVPSA